MRRAPVTSAGRPGIQTEHSNVSSRRMQSTFRVFLYVWVLSATKKLVIKTSEEQSPSILEKDVCYWHKVKRMPEHLYEKDVKNSPLLAILTQDMTDVPSLLLLGDTWSSTAAVVLISDLSFGECFKTCKKLLLIVSIVSSSPRHGRALAMQVTS